MNPANEPIGTKSNSTKAIGFFLFLGGLIMLFGTYTTGAPIAIPLMIVGIAYPFIHNYMVSRGADWDEEIGRDRPVVMSRREGRRLVREHAGDNYVKGDTSSRYEIDSTRYRDRNML